MYMRVTLKKFRKASLKQLSQGTAFCGLPTVAVGSASLTGNSTIDGGVSLIVLLGAFLMAGIWMFRRWGETSEVQAPPKPSLEVTVAAQKDHEPTNA